MAWCLTDLPADLRRRIDRFRVEASSARALKAFRIEASEDHPNTFIWAIGEDDYIRRIAYIVHKDCLRLPYALHSRIGCTLCGVRILLLQAIRLVHDQAAMLSYVL